MIAEWKGITSKVIIYCDNKAAVDFGKEDKIGKPPTWSDKRNIDLKLQINEMMRISRVRFELNHVKAH